MPNTPSREECLALAGRILAVPARTPQDLGFDVFKEYGTGNRLSNKVIVVGENRREIIAAALIFWSQHHA